MLLAVACRFVAIVAALKGNRVMDEQEFRSQDNRGVKSFAEKLADVTAVASSPGNAHADHYLRGMANGLILAQAIHNDAEPQYIEADAVRQFDYVSEARLTLSPNWHGDKVAKAQFLGRINGAIDAANKLDQVKKTLFYGRDNNLIAEGQTPLGDILLDELGDGNADPGNLIHGVIGIFTEAGELLEMLRDAYNGGGFDPINMREEIGDLFWYVAILFFEASREGTGYTFEDAMQVNIAKLRARFPNAFTEYDANNRNLAAERAILEDRAAAQLALPISQRDALMPGETHIPPPRNVGISDGAVDRYEAGGGYLPGDIQHVDPTQRGFVPR